MLNPQFIEEPLIGAEDRYNDFDDLNPPHRESDGCRKGLLWFVWSTIALAFFIIMFLYWLRWSQ